MTYKKKKWKITVSLGILLLIILIITSIGYISPVANIKIVGNVYYTEEEINKILFPSNREKSYISCFIGQVFGVHKDIPFIQQIKMEYKSLDTVEVTIYEKGIVGCISYMGQYLYFDKDGIVVDSSNDLTEGIPIIEGIKFNKVVLYEKVGTETEDIFVNILNLTQILQKNGLKIDRIYFTRDLKATLYWGDIEISLGYNTYMEDKIAVVASIMNKNGFDGLKGTLNLENYSDENNEYLFKKKE